MSQVLNFMREPVSKQAETPQLCLPAMMLTFMQDQPKLAVYDLQQQIVEANIAELQTSEYRIWLLSLFKECRDDWSANRTESTHGPKQFYLERTGLMSGPVQSLGFRDSARQGPTAVHRRGEGDLKHVILCLWRWNAHRLASHEGPTLICQRICLRNPFICQKLISKLPT